MTYPLPTGNFAWCDDYEVQRLRDQFMGHQRGTGIPLDGETGYILEVRKKRKEKSKTSKNI